MIAEEQDEKKPSPKQKQMHGDLEDKAFKGTPNRFSSDGPRRLKDL
jgi:hypothetical protein